VHPIIVAPLPGRQWGAGAGRRSRAPNLGISRRIDENLKKAAQALEKTAAAQVVLAARHGSGASAQRSRRARYPETAPGGGTPGSSDRRSLMPAETRRRLGAGSSSCGAGQH
jgi:hypothetical protein